MSSSAVVIRVQKKVVTARWERQRRWAIGAIRWFRWLEAWTGGKGLAAKGRNDAQGVTQAALKSCVFLCTQSPRTGGRLDIKDAAH